MMRMLTGAAAACLIAPFALSLSLAFAQSPEPLSGTGLRQTDVFIAGQDGYHTFRIPSVIATAKGTLLAFAEARRAGAADAGDIDLVVKRSRDGGASWSSLQLVANDGPNTVGNPCPVIDRKTGVIWLLTTRNLGADREKDIIAGTGQASRSVWVMKSADDGVTWSTAVDITSQVKRPDWTWYATGPGVGIQTRGNAASSGGSDSGSGGGRVRDRLVIPANHAEAGSGVHRSHLFYSDDGGKSWTLGADADAGTNESQVVELADGRLMLNMRNHPSRPENYRLVAISEDGGKTLSAAEPDRALVEPPAQASLVRFSFTRPADRHRLLFANPASVKRERMTVRVSDDDGKTWAASRVIHDGPAAYSSLVVLPDSGIGLLYERGERSAYETIAFARFTLDWVRAGSR
jgi:sialidase-1